MSTARASSTRQPITFGTYSFPTKVALKHAIRTEMAQYSINQQFKSDLLAQLIYYRHPYASHKALSPTLFKQAPPTLYRSGYHFEALFPSIGWRGISWNKCVTPKTYHDEVRGYLRWTLAPVLAEAKGFKCELCFDTRKLEVDHHSPTFEQMYQQAATLFTAQEIETWAYYDWDGIPGFRLPPTHPVFKAFMAAHQTAILKTFCHDCHQRATRIRRENDDGSIPEAEDEEESEG